MNHDSDSDDLFHRAQRLKMDIRDNNTAFEQENSKIRELEM